MIALVCAAALAMPVAAHSSALLTKGAGEVKVYAAAAVTEFTHEGQGGERHLLATVSREGEANHARTLVKWFRRSGSSSPKAAELDLAGLERLYEHVLHQDAAGIFEFEPVPPDTRKSKGRARIGPTQGDVLRAIALARERAVADLAASGSGLNPTPWGIASMKVLPAPAGQAADPDRITLRVHDAKERPISGVTLTASRGADMMCSAKSDARGVASCKLIDAHAHAPGEHDDDAEPTVITFPGLVSTDRIELPTTLRIEPSRPKGPK